MAAKTILRFTIDDTTPFGSSLEDTRRMAVQQAGAISYMVGQALRDPGEDGPINPSILSTAVDGITTLLNFSMMLKEIDHD